MIDVSHTRNPHTVARAPVLNCILNACVTHCEMTHLITIDLFYGDLILLQFIRFVAAL